MEKITMRSSVLLWSALAGVFCLGSGFSPYMAEGQAAKPQTAEMAAHIEAGNTQFQ